MASQKDPIEFPPLTQEQLGQIEHVLGFRIPNLLKEIYFTIGNGGFGPGTGGRIMGLTHGGYISDIGLIPEAYRVARMGADELDLEWPSAMLPFCQWGSMIYSCVACNELDSPIHLARDLNLEPQGYNLDKFVEMWIDEFDILSLDPTPTRLLEFINPFTRQNEVVEIKAPRERRKN